MSSLTCKFTESCKQSDGEKLAKIRDHFLADAIMNEKDPSSSSSINIPQVGAIVAIKDRKKREEYAKYIATALKLLNDRLDALEDKLIEKYGEYFAENLAAEHLDDETYKQLMLIDDQDERRKQIAKAINEGTENGTIDKSIINENPDFKEWLDVSKEYELNELEETMISHEESKQQLKPEEFVSHNTDQKVNLESGFDALFSKNDSIGV